MLDRTAILDLPVDEISTLGLTTESLSDHDIALIGFQRTKRISKDARKAWEAGNPQPLFDEAKARRSAIIEGAMAEIWQEYLPIRDYLNANSHRPASVADIGCGAAINDLFLARDYSPSFTLIDIEETPEQYHGWAESGSGYASLVSARALLAENGVDQINTINPRDSMDHVDRVTADLATSLYSCGFHYPVDAYLDLFLRTLEAGGCVILDLRGRYYRRRPEGLEKLLSSGQVNELYHDERSVRVAVKA